MRARYAKTATFDDIFTHGDFVALAGLAADPRIVAFIAATIAQFRERPAVPDGIRRYGGHWSTSRITSMGGISHVVDQAATHLTTLYASFEPGNLRGAVIEGLVMDRLRVRYEHNTCIDNAVITIENGHTYISSTTIDANGWDGNFGESHDCKMQAYSVDVALIQELEAGLPASHFKIGVVCASSRLVMATALSVNGYTPAAHTTLIALEDLPTLAPLQGTP